MDIITLSDHASDMIGQEKAKRQAAFDADMARYKSRVAAREAKSASLRARSQEARGQHRWLAWIGHLILRVAHTLSARPVVPHMAEETQTAAVWKAGSEGERRVADALA